MGWIKMDHDLADKPEVIQMAASLDVDEYALVGYLHAVWSWADKLASAGGEAPGVSAAWIDRRCRLPGLAAALIGVGWLEETDGGVRIPSFDKHMGQRAKARAQTQRRTEAWRDRDDASQQRHGSVTAASQQRHSSVTACVTDASPDVDVDKDKDNKPPPPPTPSSPPTADPVGAGGDAAAAAGGGGSSGSGNSPRWPAVLSRLRSCGVHDAKAAVAAAKSAEVPPREVLALIDHWQAAEGAWSAGALHWRVCSATAGQPPTEGWPEPSAAVADAKAAAAKLDQQLRTRQAVELVKAGRRRKLADGEIAKQLAAAGLDWP